MPDVAHPHTYCNDGRDAELRIHQAIDEADQVVFSYYADPIAQKLIRRRVRSGRPWVYWGERPGFRGWGLFGRLRRRVLLAPLHAGAFPIWGMGQWAVKAWREEFGNRRSYENIPYFSNLDRFASPDQRDRPRGMRRFLFSGAFIRRKGIDLLAEAFAEVAASRPQIQLDFVGAGELEPVVKCRLASYSSRLRFRGFQQWQELPACYHEADILVAPSRYDGWGLIVPEGLAAGLPVISTDCTGAALELVRPGTSGWIVRAGDVRSLALALAEAADLPDDRIEAMSAAALTSVAEHSLSHGVRRFIAAARAALVTANVR
jgi:glycosyltransferase involved in cell wall biosynthesis